MSRRVVAFGRARLVLETLVGCFAIGLVAATVALAASLTMGNAAVDRPNLDTFRNFILVDQSNSADADGLLNEIRYYAKLSAARDQGATAFAIVRGDQAAGFKVIWISENVAKPASSGVRPYVPATPIPIKAGDNLAIYFEKQGLVPYTLVDETDPQQWEFWQPSTRVSPQWRHARALGPPRDRYPAQAQLLRRGLDDRLRVQRQTADQGGRLQCLQAPWRHPGEAEAELRCQHADSDDQDHLHRRSRRRAEQTVSSVGSANTGATMRWAGEHYIYNLAVKGKAPGEYRLSFNVAGVEAASVVFTLRGSAVSRGVGQRGAPGKSGMHRPSR